jgi:outer membrane lipoprotein-sorting protein
MYYSRKTSLRALVLATLIGLAQPGQNAYAQSDPEQPLARGLEIAQESDRRDTGWGDSATELTMVLRNAHGQKSTRSLRTKTLETYADGDKTLIVFDEPRDVSGTAFLSHTHALQPDDQWLYLPSLKRVKRISSANKSGPFMGSEFAYEDISSQEVEKYEYRFAKETELDGQRVYQVEQIPAYEKSGYTRMIVWYDVAEYRRVRAEFYDRKGELLKTLRWLDYRKYNNRYWRSHRMEMENHQTGKSTTLTFSDYSFGNGFSDRDFDQNSLRRVR